MLVVMSDVEMKEPPRDFILSRVLQAHKGEVKTVAATTQGMLLSGGRDETVKMWISRGGDYTEQMNLPQTPKGAIIYAVAMFEDDDGWRLFVGRKDGVIAVYGSGGGNDPLLTVKHHQSVVSCLTVDSRNGKLISGSWDNHVIIWPISALLPNSELSALLCEGHTMSVWAVASIESSPDLVLSASADQSIRLWRNDNCEREYRGHTDVVRALVVVDARRFLSAANDFTVRMWTIDSTSALASFKSPHEEFIYSMSRVGDNTLVTCGEGGHITVWGLDQTETNAQDAVTVTQSLATPVASLWCVSGLPNGDVALASSDGRIFIMTRDERRIATEDVRECLDAEMAARLTALLQQQHEKESETVTIKVALDDGSPNMELKYVKGTDPSLAAEKFITDNGLPISYLNEITDYIRQNIPEAREYRPNRVAAVAGAGGQHAFEIIAEDGRKLVVNFTDNDDADAVAQDFVERNGLPIKYLATTSRMVRQEQAASLKAATADFYDPFTGGGRYVPSSGNAGFDPNAAADPLTGGGRYVPGQASSSSSGGIGGGDPLTSGGRYIPGMGKETLMPNASLPMDKKKPRGELCPLKTYFIFGKEQFSQKAFDRLIADNAKAAEPFQLNEGQVQLLQVLAKEGVDSIVDLDALIGALNLGLHWGMEELLPIVDMLRIAVLNENVNKYYAAGEGSAEFRPRLLALLVSDSPDPVKALLCRTICNFFSHAAGREMATAEMKTLMPVVGTLVLSPRPVLQTAAASALSNWAYLLLNTSETVCELGPREDGVREIVKVLESTLSFGGYREDALTRVLQAISTLMWGDVTVIKLAKSRNIVEVVNRIKDAVVDERGKSLCRDIVEMTFAV